MAYQQPYPWPPHPYPPHAYPPAHNGNGNGRDAATAYLTLPRVLVLATAVAAGTWTAAVAYSGFQAKERTTAEKLEDLTARQSGVEKELKGVDKRLVGMEGSLNELVAKSRIGPWTVETRRQ